MECFKKEHAKSDLSHIEKLQAVALLDDPWTPENGCRKYFAHSLVSVNDFDDFSDIIFAFAIFLSHGCQQVAASQGHRGLCEGVQ